jgi:hypothetical protein
MYSLRRKALQVYAGFEAYHDGVDERRQLHKVFKDALKWAEALDMEQAQFVYRFYQPIELE